MRSSSTNVATSLARVASRPRHSSQRLSRPYVCRQCRSIQSDIKNIFLDTYAQGRLGVLGALHTAEAGSLGSDAKSRTRFPYNLYPQIRPDSSVHPRAFEARYGEISKDQLERSKVQARLVGKVTARRYLGKNLIFVNLTREDITIQVVINAGYIMKLGAASAEEFEAFKRSMKSNDYWAFDGKVTRYGQQDTLSLLCETLPQMLGPSLQDPPVDIENDNVLGRFPQFNLLNQQARRDTLRMRHTLERTLQESLNGLGFTKVSTPVLAADSGGAIATPFETVRNDGSKTKLSLRIAQELALKQLVAADLGPVYEIGPVFRNEGIDATHNPEFTTCEFYLPYTNLEELLHLTESIIRQINIRIQRQFKDSPALNKAITPTTFAHFRRLQFLPALMDQLSTRAPDFRLPHPLGHTAAPKLVALFGTLGLELPEERTTAHLLDVLGAEFVESQCKGPTFIMNYPAIMSPLAKSHYDHLTGHYVSARAELFIEGVEYANMYEEENNPISQAQKFLLQSSSDWQVSNPLHTEDGKAASETAIESRTSPAESEASSEENIHALASEHLTPPPLVPTMTKVYNKMPAYDTDESLRGVRIWNRHQAVVAQLTPGQQYYVKCLEIGMPPTAGWGCGIERLLMLFSGAKRISEVLPFGNLRSVIAMGTGGGKGKSGEVKGSPKTKAEEKSVHDVSDVSLK